MKLWNKAINGFPPETRNGACTSLHISFCFNDDDDDDDDIIISLSLSLSLCFQSLLFVTRV
jgi:hypothetical protein